MRKRATLKSVEVNDFGINTGKIKKWRKMRQRATLKSVKVNDFGLKSENKGDWVIGVKEARKIAPFSFFFFCFGVKKKSGDLQ